MTFRSSLLHVTRTSYWRTGPSNRAAGSDKHLSQGQRLPTLTEAPRATPLHMDRRPALPVRVWGASSGLLTTSDANDPSFTLTPHQIDDPPLSRMGVPKRTASLRGEKAAARAWT